MDGRLQNSRLMMEGVVLSWIMDFSGIARLHVVRRGVC